MDFIMILVLLLVLFGGVYFLRRILPKAKKKLNVYVDSVEQRLKALEEFKDKQKPAQSGARLSSELAALQARCEALEEKVRQLEQLSQQNETWLPPVGSVNVVPAGPEERKKHEVREPATFYAKAYDEGSRLTVAASQSPDAPTSAPFLVHVDDACRATIVFNEQAFAKNINLAEIRIKPFCRLLNAIDDRAVGIKTEVPGTLKRVGNEWQIVEKPQIRFV